MPRICKMLISTKVKINTGQCGRVDHIIRINGAFYYVNFGKTGDWFTIDDLTIIPVECPEYIKCFLLAQKLK